jgi:hypothetical protein
MVSEAMERPVESDSERTKSKDIDWWHGSVLAAVAALWLHLVTNEVQKPYLVSKLIFICAGTVEHFRNATLVKD